MIIARHFFCIGSPGICVFCPLILLTCVCVCFVSACVYGNVCEVDGLGFMMITLSEGVRNQSNPKPQMFRLLSPQAISMVGIDYATHSCLSGGPDERERLRNGEMIMQLLGGSLCRPGSNARGERKLNVRDKQMYYHNLGE